MEFGPHFLSFPLFSDDYIDCPNAELGDAGHAVLGVLVVLQFLDDGVFQYAVAHAVDEGHLGVFGGDGAVEHLLEVVGLDFEHVVARHTQNIVHQLTNM